MITGQEDTLQERSMLALFARVPPFLDSDHVKHILSDLLRSCNLQDKCHVWMVDVGVSGSGSFNTSKLTHKKLTP
jgi:hypothetical protein